MMVRSLGAVLATIHVCAVGAQTPTEPPAACSDSSSLLQSDVRVDGGPAAPRARAGKKPLPLEGGGIGLLSTDLHALTTSVEGSGPQKPSRWKFIVAWAVPLVFLFGAWLMPCMYGRGAGEGAASAEEVIETKEEAPKQAPEESGSSATLTSMFSVLRRIGPLWPPIVFLSLADGISGPGGAYIGVNFFAQKYTDLPWSQIHCELDPNQPHCSKGVMDFTQVNTYTGLVAPFVQILLGPALGTLSDSYGRRRILAAVWLLGFVPQICVASHMYRGTTLWMAYYLVPLSDLPTGAVAYAYIIDCLRDPKSLALAFGMQGAAGTLCHLVGMIIGARLTLRTTFTVGFVIKAATMAYVALLLPESLPAEARRPLKPRTLVPGFNFEILLRNELLTRLAYFAVGCTFVDAGFQAITGSWLQLYMKWTYHATYLSSILGNISVIIGLTLGMRFVVVWLGDIGVLGVHRWAGICSGVIFLFARAPLHIYIIQAIFQGPIAMGGPCIAAIKGQLIPASEQGQLQAALNSVGSIAGSIGPLCFGIIFRATNNVDGIRTKESNTMLFYALVQSVILALSLFTIAPLMRKFLPKEGAAPLKSKKLCQ